MCFILHPYGVLDFSFFDIFFFVAVWGTDGTGPLTMVSIMWPIEDFAIWRIHRCIAKWIAAVKDVPGSDWIQNCGTTAQNVKTPSCYWAPDIIPKSWNIATIWPLCPSSLASSSSAVSSDWQAMVTRMVVMMMMWACNDCSELVMKYTGWWWMMIPHPGHR